MRSIERRFPGLTIQVQHTGGNLSWGRNQLVRACRTPYLLLLEDDFEFSAETDIAMLLDILRRDDELAGVGGTLVEKNQRRAWRHNFDVFRDRALLRPSNLPWRAAPCGAVYQPCHAILNFGLFRREVMTELPWDEDLPLSEHRDWYFRLWRGGRWRVALAPRVSILHHRDRPAGYREDRRRSFLHRVRRKHGLRFESPLPPSTGPARPNLLVLGVGHANTSITARQLAALGWRLGDADEQYAESVSVRSVNQRFLASGSFDCWSAIKALRGLPAPWVLKDPRFAETLPRWLALLAPYEPLLLWVTKSSRAVAASYVRRGLGEERARSVVAARHQSCARHFEWWPWAKLHVDADQVRTAVEMFDIRR